MRWNNGRASGLDRRAFLRLSGRSALAWALSAGRTARADEGGGTSAIEFEETLASQRERFYREREVDIIQTGFRPIGGKVADFAVAHLDGRVHFFYIERRLQEGTPFYPGHETYFGHASTADFTRWQVHDPVLLIRPGTWEGVHVWAPCILQRGHRYIMAYTGVNQHVSQNIGLASSDDLLEWKRWDTNPISPCRDSAWAFWREDGIASCRDPNLIEHDGRFLLTYTANTKEGASCIAMTSSPDLATWRDQGPICIGPAGGYEPRLESGHPQGSLESANLLTRKGRWFLLVKAKVREDNNRSWVITSDRPNRFEFGLRQPFWPGSLAVEIVANRDQESLVATFVDGGIRFGVTDWRKPSPTARFVTSTNELAGWL